MANYRLYKLTSAGQKIPGPAMVLDLDRDDQAFSAAMQMTLPQQGAEVWLANRLICRLPPAHPRKHATNAQSPTDPQIPRL